MTRTLTTTQMHRVYIRSTPERIWDAITEPEWTQRYGYRPAAEFDLRPGGSYRALATEELKKYGTPDVMVDGQVVESDPPRKLVHTFRMVMNPDLADEGFTTVTYDIKPLRDGVTRLTVTHDLTGAPEVLVTMVSGAIEDVHEDAGGGWPWILSDLKTLLESGHNMATG